MPKSTKNTWYMVEFGPDECWSMRLHYDVMVRCNDGPAEILHGVVPLMRCEGGFAWPPAPGVPDTEHEVQIRLSGINHAPHVYCDPSQWREKLPEQENFAETCIASVPYRGRERRGIRFHNVSPDEHAVKRLDALADVFKSMGYTVRKLK